MYDHLDRNATCRYQENDNESKLMALSAIEQK